MSDLLTGFMQQCVESAPVESHSVGVYCTAALLLKSIPISSTDDDQVSEASESPPSSIIPGTGGKPVFVLDLLLGWGGFMSAIFASVAVYIADQVERHKMGVYEVTRDVGEGVGRTPGNSGVILDTGPNAISVVVGNPDPSIGGSLPVDPIRQKKLDACRAAGVSLHPHVVDPAEADFVSHDLEYFDNVYPRAKHLLYYAGFDRERWQINHAIYPKQHQFSGFAEFRWFANRNPLHLPMFAREEFEEMARHEEWRKMVRERRDRGGGSSAGDDASKDDFYLDYLWGLYFPFSKTVTGGEGGKNVTKISPSDLSYLLGKENGRLEKNVIRKSYEEEKRQILESLRETTGELTPAFVQVYDERYNSLERSEDQNESAFKNEDSSPNNNSPNNANHDSDLLLQNALTQEIFHSCPTPLAPGRFLKPVQATMLYAEPFPQGINEKVGWPLYNYFGRLSADREERGRALELLKYAYAHAPLTQLCKSMTENLPPNTPTAVFWDMAYHGAVEWGLIEQHCKPSLVYINNVNLPGLGGWVRERLRGMSKEGWFEIWTGEYGDEYAEDTGDEGGGDEIAAKLISKRSYSVLARVKDFEGVGLEL